MKCKSCGAEVDSGLLFCPSCGALVKLSGTEPAESSPQAQPPQIEEGVGSESQFMTDCRAADSQAKPDVALPAVFRQTQEPTAQSQSATVPVDEVKASPGKSAFEILPSNGGDNSKSGNKTLPSISPKVLIGVIAALAVVVIILFTVLLNSGNQDNHNTIETTTSQPVANQTQVEEYICDEYGIFTDEELRILENEASEIAQEYGIGVYFLTTDYMDGLPNPTASQRTDYATTYYREHGLGLNKEENGIGDGIMFVLAVDSRDYVTIAYGQGSYSFTDKDIEAMEAAVTDKLRDDDWYGGAATYLASINGLLQGDELNGTEEGNGVSGNAATGQDEGNRQVSASEYDLSNLDDYKLINTFLSNFSEVYGHTASLNTSTMSAEDYARFGVYHCGINSHDDWQFAGGSGSYSDVQGTGGGAQGVYNVRVDSSRVAEMVNRYFGISIDYSSISGGYRGPYHYQDGYVYFGVTAPVSPAGVAVAKSIEHLGNSEYEIKFDVYTPSGGYYDASDTSLYSASASEVAGKMGVSSPTASGTAIVRKAGNNEYTGGLVLESYRSELL